MKEVLARYGPFTITCRQCSPLGNQGKGNMTSACVFTVPGSSSPLAPGQADARLCCCAEKYPIPGHARQGVVGGALGDLGFMSHPAWCWAVLLC